MTYYTDLFKTSDVLVMNEVGLEAYPEYRNCTFELTEDDETKSPYFNVINEDDIKIYGCYISLEHLKLENPVVVKEVSKVDPSHSTVVVIVVKENESSLKLNRAFTDTELDVLNALFGGAQ